MHTLPSLPVHRPVRRLPRFVASVRTAIRAALFLLPLVLPPLSTAEDYRIKPDSPDTVDLGHVGLRPGDTVHIEAHTRKRLIIQNLTAGTPTNPVYITNSGGQFVIDTTDTDKGLHFYNCRYFVLRGTPVTVNGASDYGIKIARVSQPGAIGLAFVQGTTDFEVSHLEIGHVGFAGVMAKSDGITRDVFTMRNVSIHNLYVHDTGGEAIYVGDSAYHDTVKNAHAIHGVNIYRNRIENAGWDGIQLGSATQDAAVYENRIVGYGAADLDAANHYAQNEGIRINPGTTAVVHSNWIEGRNAGSGSGIFANPHDDSVYYNNVIVAPGESGIVISADYALNPGTTVALLNNTIVEPAQHGIEFWSTGSVGSLDTNNLISAPGGDFVRFENGATDLTTSNARHYATLADAGFTNASSDDYRLAAGSTAIDQGADVSALGVANDIQRVTRPFGSAYDIGAYEYFASPDGAPIIATQLTSTTALVGAEVTLEVIAAGDAPLTYAWTKNGTPIADATTNTLTFPAVALADAGDYAVVISNALGSITSATATLTVTTPPPLPPTIVTQPASQTVATGTDVTLAVDAYGADPLTYQWYKDGSPLAGATAAELLLPAVAVSDSGSYTVMLANGVGTLTSEPAILTVNAPPTAPTTFEAATIVSDATVLPHVDPGKTYTHKININASSVVTVNGLAFDYGTGNGGGAQPARNYSVNTFNNAITTFNSSATGDIHALLTTRATNTNSASYALTLTGLAAGQRYTFALFTDSAHGVGRNWYRVSQGADTLTYDIDFSAGGVGSSRALAISYTATAPSMTFTFTRLDGVGTTSSTSWIGFAGFVNYDAAMPPVITTQPAAQTAAASSNVTFTVAASGTAPFSYQWTKDGVAIPGATAAALTLYNVQPPDAGNYGVTVSNTAGSVTSDAATLTVGSTLYDVANLVSDATIAPHVNATNSYTHAINLNASTAVSVNGLPFAYGTGNGGGAQPALNYTITPFNHTVTNFAATATGEIRGVLLTRGTNTSSASYTLNLAGLTAGATYTFALFNDSSHGPGRNWYRVSQDIDASTFALDFSAAGVNSSRLLTITFTPPGPSVTFTFTRLDGTANTNTTSWIGFAGFVNYTLPASPTIITPPRAQTVDAGSPAVFAVAARGQTPLTYQWLKNGVPIAGATQAALVLSAVQLADAGDYSVVVSNPAGSATSSAATLTVNPLVAPTLSMQPASQSAEVGASVSLSVTASGTAPLSYQWTKEGAAISGATGPTLALNNVQLSDAGSYTVTVTNTAGSVTSEAAVLTVTTPPPVAPTITTQPTSRTVDINLNTTFTVVASGTAPLSYQWFKDGAPLPGATNATLALSAVQPAQAGSYTVVVSNEIGSVTSAAATLTVTIPRQTAQRASIPGQFDINYLLYLPTGYEDDGDETPWPLVVFLHGQGERSSNEADPMDPIHLNKLRTLGPPLRIEQGAEFPFLVVSPQCAIDWWNGAQLEAFITELQQRYRIDRTRIYLTGLSMGGFGVYDLAQRNPSRYAAIAPMSAAPQVDAANAAAAPGLRDLPLWHFHGANDPLYSVADVQAYLDLIRNVGGAPLVTIYTTSPGNLHNAWIPAYADNALYDWLMTHAAQPPAIVAPPLSADALVGESVSFTVNATGRWPLTYRWTHNGAVIAGATGPTLALANLTQADAGLYAVTVTNGVGSATSAPVSLSVKIPASVALGNLAQPYDGEPKPATATTVPADLEVLLTYNGSTTPPTLPGAYTVEATIIDADYAGSATAELVISAAALVRHAPMLNGGLDGSAQALSGESTTLNGAAWVSGDLLVPGTPQVNLNGQPTYAGTHDNDGAATPANYTITLNGGSVLRHVVRRVDPIPLPVVAAPLPPTGTASITLNNPNQTVTDWSTLRNLTLNGGASLVAVPPGAYGSFLANGSSGFVFGTPGAVEPDRYDLQSLTLNGSAQVQVVGPVVLTLKHSLTFGGSIGAAAHPEWLSLRVQAGGVTLNSGATLHGRVLAPAGTVIINDDATLHGDVRADRLIINTGGLLSQPTPAP